MVVRSLRRSRTTRHVAERRETHLSTCSPNDWWTHSCQVVVQKHVSNLQLFAEVNRGLFLNIVVAQGPPVLELLTCKDEALLIRETPGFSTGARLYLAQARDGLHPSLPVGARAVVEGVPWDSSKRLVGTLPADCPILLCSYHWGRSLPVVLHPPFEEEVVTRGSKGFPVILRLLAIGIDKNNNQ